MPPATRSRTAAAETAADVTRTGATPDDAQVPGDRAPGGAEPGSRAATAAPGPRPPDTADLGRAVGRVITLPVTVVRAVAEDVASTARRPDAILYWVGLAGLTALGLLEWPVAAAVGVGVAVANGRRPGPRRATTPPTA